MLDSCLGFVSSFPNLVPPDHPLVVDTSQFLVCLPPSSLALDSSLGTVRPLPSHSPHSCWSSPKPSGLDNSSAQQHCPAGLQGFLPRPLYLCVVHPSARTLPMLLRPLLLLSWNRIQSSQSPVSVPRSVCLSVCSVAILRIFLIQP